MPARAGGWTRRRCAHRKVRWPHRTAPATGGCDLTTFAAGWCASACVSRLPGVECTPRLRAQPRQWQHVHAVDVGTRRLPGLGGCGERDDTRRSAGSVRVQWTNNEKTERTDATAQQKAKPGKTQVKGVCAHVRGAVFRRGEATATSREAAKTQLENHTQTDTDTDRHRQTQTHTTSYNTQTAEHLQPSFLATYG